eukprot:RCo043866
MLRGTFRQLGYTRRGVLRSAVRLPTLHGLASPVACLPAAAVSDGGGGRGGGSPAGAAPLRTVLLRTPLEGGASGMQDVHQILASRGDLVSAWEASVKQSMSTVGADVSHAVVYGYVLSATDLDAVQRVLCAMPGLTTVTFVQVDAFSVVQCIAGVRLTTLDVWAPPKSPNAFVLGDGSTGYSDCRCHDVHPLTLVHLLSAHPTLRRLLVHPAQVSPKAEALLRSSAPRLSIEWERGNALDRSMCFLLRTLSHKGTVSACTV